MTVYEICDKYELPYSIIEGVYSSMCEGADGITFEEACKLIKEQR